MFSELDKPCPGGFRMGCYHEKCCMEAMLLYKGYGKKIPLIPMKNINEMDPTHPPGCHVMHATGEWHFNAMHIHPERFDPDLVVKGVHQICKAVKGILDEFP